jgi:hypothetical protein
MDSPQKIKSKKSIENPRANNNFPLTMDHFLNAVDDAAQRSRRLLSILVFSSIIILMALVNSLPVSVNWYTSKQFLFKNIHQHVYLPEFIEGKIQKMDTINFRDYMFQNESIVAHNRLSKSDSDKIVSLSKVYEKFNLNGLYVPKLAPVYGTDLKTRIENYENIGKALKFAAENNISNKEFLQNNLDKLTESRIEHIDMVRVPILGVLFHINYLGFYSGLTISVLYFLFYFSLKREHINTKIAFRSGWENIKSDHHHYYYYEYLSMFQVLTIPKKLFTTNKTNFIYTAFSSTLMRIPYIIFFFVVLYDYLTISVGYKTNILLTYVILFFNTAFLFLNYLLGERVAKFWKKMDMLWEYQSFEFNFECILEKIDQDNPKDFDEFTTCILTPADLQNVKKYWTWEVQNYIKTTKKIQTSTCFKMYRKFINNLLDEKFLFPNEIDEIAIKKADANWEYLNNWYQNYGKKGTTNSFKREFLAMIEKIKDSN